MSRGSLSTSKDARSHIEDFIKQSAELFSEEKLKALLIGDKLDNKFGREDCLKSIQQIENFYYEAKSLLEDNLRECGRLKPSFCNWEFVPMDENFSDQRIIEGQTPLPFIDKKYKEKKDLARMERRENLQ